MHMETLKRNMADLRLLVLFPRRYGHPTGMSEDYWRGVSRRYSNYEKVLTCSDWHWRIIEYDDGHRELTYLRVLGGEYIYGRYSSIFRGLIIPRRITHGTFARIRRITIAF